MNTVQGVMSSANIKGLYDYIGSDGKLYLNNEARSVMVTAETDLANLTGYKPGAVAYTAGYAAMWQLAANGSWTQFQPASASE